MSKKEIQKERKLNELQTKHRRLLVERLPIQTNYKQKSRELDKIRKVLNKKNSEIKEVGEQIFHLKHDGETPHVTDHAVVRYLERVEGLDVWDLKSRIANDKNAVREGNVIVTVNEDLESELS